MAKLTRITAVILTLLLGACASPQLTNTSPTPLDHCDVTKQYADLSVNQLQESFQKDEETKGTTASYRIDACHLLTDENKALSLMTVKANNKDGLVTGEMGFAVLLINKQEGWEVVDLMILYAERYESSATKNKTNED